MPLATQALVVRDLPEISQTVLNLAEFMEHCERGPLPIDPTLLGEQAVKCRAYAKALHYKEMEFFHQPTVPGRQFNCYFATFLSTNWGHFCYLSLM